MIPVNRRKQPFPPSIQKGWHAPEDGMRYTTALPFL